MAIATCPRQACSYRWFLRVPNPKLCPQCHRRLQPPTKRDREIARKGQRNRRARKANSVCEHGPGCFDAAAQSMHQLCAIPGCRNKDIHADHIIPLAKGGLDCRDNLQPLCQRHNSAKQATDPIDFARRHGMLF